MRRRVNLHAFIFWTVITVTNGQRFEDCVIKEENFHTTFPFPTLPPVYGRETEENIEGEEYDEYGRPLNNFDTLLENRQTPAPPPSKNITVICTNAPFYLRSAFMVCGSCWKLIYKDSNVTIIPTNTYQDASKLEELQMVNLGIEKIEAGAFAHLPSLKVLWLGRNKLKKISRGSFNSIINLRYLNLSHNIISEIEDESFHGSFRIQNLDISFNKIRFIPKNIFQHHDLNVLNISNNLLATIEDDFCGSIPQLTSLILDHNLLTRFPSCLEQSIVTHLSCKFNFITSLNNSIFPRSLEILCIGNNQVNQLDEDVFAFVPNLKELDISCNALKNITPNHFKDIQFLESLDLSGINLRTISSELFSSLRSLRELRIKQNNLNSLQNEVFQYLSNLTLLDLSENEIKFLLPGVLKDLSSLKFFNLSHNKLEFLQSGVLNGMEMLDSMDLSWNHLESLQIHIFDTLIHLKWVDLKYNQIQTLFITNKEFRPRTLAIELDGNNFTCATLSVIESELLSSKIVLISGKTVSSENIKGISCNDNRKKLREANKEDIISEMRYFFQNEFRNTSFYNFFQNFGGINNDNAIQQRLIKVVENIQNSFSNSLNVHVGEFMRFENASFKNFLKELAVIVHRLEETEKLNESVSLEDLSRTFKNEIKTFVTFENTSFQNFMEKLSDIVDKMTESQNRSEHIPNFLEKINEIRADKLTNSKEKNETIELIGAINQLKVFIILCTFMGILLVIGSKIFPYAKKEYLRARSSEGQVHEMPILS